MADIDRTVPRSSSLQARRPGRLVQQQRPRLRVETNTQGCPLTSTHVFSLSLSLLWVSLLSDLAMTTAAPSGQDKGSWGHGLVSGWCVTTLQSAEAWGALERPKVRAGRDPGTPGQAKRDSEVAEDLSLPVPVHLWCPLVDPSSSSLLLGLSCCGTQVEATFLEGVSLPGTAILIVLL